MKYQVKIDRSKWVNGTNERRLVNRPAMLNDVGNMCCLGHACSQIHNLEPNEDWLFESTPYGVYRRLGMLNSDTPKIFIKDAISVGELASSEFTGKAMKINDAPYMAPEIREEELIKLFAENDIELSFYGELYSYKG